MIVPEKLLKKKIVFKCNIVFVHLPLCSSICVSIMTIKNVSNMTSLKWIEWWVDTLRWVTW